MTRTASTEDGRVTRSGTRERASAKTRKRKSKKGSDLTEEERDFIANTNKRGRELGHLVDVEAKKIRMPNALRNLESPRRKMLRRTTTMNLLKQTKRKVKYQMPNQPTG